jgi:hypothetical protein
VRRERARGVGERGKTVVRGCGLRKQRCAGKSEAALHRGSPHKSPLPGNIFLSQSAPRSDPAFTAPITLARLRVLCGWAPCPLGLRPWIYSGVNSPASGRAKLRVCFRRMSAVRWSIPLMRLRCFPDKLSAVHCFSELLGSTRSCPPERSSPPCCSRRQPQSAPRILQQSQGDVRLGFIPTLPLNLSRLNASADPVS